MDIYRKKYFQITLFILPAFLFYAVFLVYPILETVELSFFKWNGIKGVEKIFVGADNFINLLSDNLFLKTIKNSILIIIFTLMIQLPLGGGLAYILSLGLKGTRYFKIAFFMPFVLSATAVALMWRFILHPNNGLLNIILGMVGLESLQQPWLSQPVTALASIIVVGSWQGLGIVIILFYAGIVSIPQSIIESVKLDGINTYQYFRYILLPMLMEEMKVVIVLVILGGIKSFDLVYVLTGGGPYQSTEVLTTNMYQEAFGRAQFGSGSAMALFILCFSLILTLITNKIIKKTH